MNFTVNVEGIDEELSVYKSSLVYLSDLPPNRVWEARGRTAHDNDQRELDQLKRNHVREFTESTTFQDRMQTFLDGVGELFVALRNGDREGLWEMLPPVQFFFVIGHMRSGGTYLLNELMKCHGLPLEDYNQGMVHDGCPRYSHLRLWSPGEEPSNQLLFDLAQYLHWVRLEFASGSYVFKKRIAFAHCLRLLDRYFGGRATYLITVRDPEESAESFRAMEGIDRVDSGYKHPGWKQFVLDRLDLGEDTWDSLNYYQKYLYHWTAYYYDVAHRSPEVGTLIPLRFASGYGRFLSSHWEEHGDGEASDPPDFEEFTPTDRARGTHLDRTNVERSIDFLNRTWSENDRAFPLPGKDR